MANAQQDPLDAIRNSQVWSSQQSRYVPFRQVSKGIELESEEVQIHRRDRVPTITIWAEPGSDETAADALARIWQPIQDMQLPDGYKLEWGGEYESSADAQQALGKGLPAGFLVMFIISVLLFGRARQPLIIWAIVPMATVGVVSGLLLTDMPFGFMSLLGFLSLFGMLIKNAIVLLEEIDLQIEEDKPIKDAILEASASRLRPVTLAAITTILGMAPLLSDAFFADMSVTIMGGLAFATVLTLIAVPVMYSLLYRVSFRK
jgi:multidrug efflux pump subunit AcrB